MLHREDDSSTSFDREKWASERGFRERELAIQEGELELHRKEQTGSGWRSPLVVAILAATAAAAGSAVVAVVNGHLQRDLESQQSQHTRILEMIKTGGADKAAENLEFLLKTGLIDEPVLAQRIQKYLADRVPGTGPALPATSGSIVQGDTESFFGVERKAAKLSIVPGAPQVFSDLGAVLDALTPDAEMRALKISSGPDSGRVAQEQKLVTVSAFLYAAKRESSNDFTCIVGIDPSKPARFMIAKVSGLPPPSSQFFAALKDARNQFKLFFNSTGLPWNGYDKYDPPIPIKVTGSLYFNVAHPGGAVGPTGMKPLTAWEIHPVSDIQFDQ